MVVDTSAAHATGESTVSSATFPQLAQARLGLHCTGFGCPQAGFKVSNPGSHGLDQLHRRGGQESSFLDIGLCGLGDDLTSIGPGFDECDDPARTANGGENPRGNSPSGRQYEVLVNHRASLVIRRSSRRYRCRSWVICRLRVAHATPYPMIKIQLGLSR